jgi:hypothetical protein
MPKFSRIYAHKCANLGVVVPKKPSKQASRLLEMAKHSSLELSNSKEEMVEEIDWTSKRSGKAL